MNTFIRILYHTGVMLIGRRLEGTVESLPGFGRAVSNVTRKAGSHPSSKTR